MLFIIGARIHLIHYLWKHPSGRPEIFLTYVFKKNFNKIQHLVNLDIYTELRQQNLTPEKSAIG